jgi:pyrroloquinoline quinone (PQQ) biosynthesis protein C
MENMQSPYTQGELNTDLVRDNLSFLTDLESRIRSQGIFDHPLLQNLAEGNYKADGLKLVMAQFSKHVGVFTAALSALLGNTPDIKSRFVLFDNLYEEMGRGTYEQSHFRLYISMLESMGIKESELKNYPPLCSIEILNDTLMYTVTQKPFIVGLAWLGLGGEVTIPNNFPFLVQAIKSCFPADTIDWQFFDRHGGRDQMHNDDANILLALYMQEEDRPLIELEVMKSLSARKAVWDELEAHVLDSYIVNGSSKVA